MTEARPRHARSLEPGQTFEFRGQLYFVTGLRPHERRDGSRTVLADLGSHCADCGAWFAASVPATATAARIVPNRRCDMHKARGRRVRALHPWIFD